MKAGQLLAKLGSTGHSDEPHLHFHLVDANSNLALDGVPYELRSFTQLGVVSNLGSLLAGRAWRAGSSVPAASPAMNSRSTAPWRRFHRRSAKGQTLARRWEPDFARRRQPRLADASQGIYVYISDLRYTFMRTNIEIDDKLMADALQATGLKTKREAVELGLKTLLRLRRQEELRAFRGKLDWTGDLEAMRLDG